MEDIVLYFSLKYNGDFKRIYEALSQKEKIDLEEQQRLKSSLKSRYTTLFSDDYPERLKNIQNPPFVLYYYGNIHLCNDSCIAVVGMRDASDYGRSCTSTLSESLVKKGYTIVSGMAKGIDTIAHQSAIIHQGNTIAVLGTGIDYCYPLSNERLYECLKNEQLVISEYPFKTTTSRKQFPMRNRIVVGLSRSVLVTEAKLKSGTMITVGYALEQGKNVYCVPGRISDHEGCNALIQQGAYLIKNANEIIELE